MYFRFITSLWELFSLSYFCTKRDPRIRYKFINYANVLAIRVEKYRLIIMTKFAMCKPSFQQSINIYLAELRREVEREGVKIPPERERGVNIPSK